MSLLSIHKLFQSFVYNPQAPMLFNTGFFLFLFLFFIIIYQSIYQHHRLKIAFLTLFSFYFYYKSSGVYFVLLLFSIFIDFNLANWIYNVSNKKHKKVLLILSLVVNLGMLAYYKYTNFFIDTLSIISKQPIKNFDIFLPVGISFFTFQSLSYTIDVYRGTLKPIKSIAEYAFFVSFFPQLVAGPIVRASDFIPQIKQTPFVTKQMFGRGVFLIATGLFKKAVISDYISANFVDRVFENPALYTGLENLMAVYGYALQIYCDFSGYSDMAIGIALLLGYRFCINFNSPYQASNITEFWRRWHISLSTWLRDYLYIALGGNRNGTFKTYFNLIITMLLGGLWHGAAFRFIVWGALHGVGLAVHKFYTQKTKQYFPKINTENSMFAKIIGTFITFNFVCFAWIFFRAADMQTALNIIHQIAFNFQPQIAVDFVIGYKNVLFVIILGYFLHFLPQTFEVKTENWVTNSRLITKVALVALIIVIIEQVKSAEIQPFIYFQF